MNPDPYSPPQLRNHPSSSQENEPSPVILEHLRKTRPWVKFCSLAGYVSAGFLIVICLFTLQKSLTLWPLLHVVLIGVFYFILATLFTIPSLYLSRYEKSITHLLVSKNLDDLEQALADQRSFWKLMAIMILILLTLYLISLAYSAIIILSLSR